MRENDYYYNIVIIHCIALRHILPWRLYLILLQSFIIDLITYISADEENFHVNYQRNETHAWCHKYNK